MQTGWALWWRRIALFIRWIQHSSSERQRGDSVKVNRTQKPDVLLNHQVDYNPNTCNNTETHDWCWLCGSKSNWIKCHCKSWIISFIHFTLVISFNLNQSTKKQRLFYSGCFALKNMTLYVHVKKYFILSQIVAYIHVAWYNTCMQCWEEPPTVVYVWQYIWKILQVRQTGMVTTSFFYGFLQRTLWCYSKDIIRISDKWSMLSVL